MVNTKYVLMILIVFTILIVSSSFGGITQPTPLPKWVPVNDSTLVFVYSGDTIRIVIATDTQRLTMELVSDAGADTLYIKADYILADTIVSTQVIVPLVIGGTETTSDLSLQTTSGTGASGADMHFLVGSDGATEAMTILNNGRVGIGTSTPNGTLEVKGPNPGDVGGFSAGVLQVTGTSATQFTPVVITGHNSYSGNTQLWYLGSMSSANDDIVFINRQDADLSFFTNDIERLRVTNTGNVGIGTGLAPYLLTVLGDIALGDTAVADLDVFLRVGTDGSWTTTFLTWNDGLSEWQFSHDLTVTGNLTISEAVSADSGHFALIDLDTLEVGATPDIVTDITGAGLEMSSSSLQVTDDIRNHTLDSNEVMTILRDSTTTIDTLTYKFIFADPNTLWDVDSLFCFEPITASAITITRIDITCDADPATEPAMTLRFADNFISRTTPTTIDVVTTTVGVTTITGGFDDATVPGSNCMYADMTVQPIAAIKSITFKISYTVD